jgi:hypothetical protein
MGVEIGRRLKVAAALLGLGACLVAAPSASAATSVTATVAKLGDAGYVVTVNDPAGESISLFGLQGAKPFADGQEGMVGSSIVSSAGCKLGMPLSGLIGCSGFSSGSAYVCYVGPPTTYVQVQIAETPLPVGVPATTAPEVHSCPVAGFSPPSGPTTKQGKAKKPTKHHKRKHRKKKKKPHAKPVRAA